MFSIVLFAPFLEFWPVPLLLFECIVFLGGDDLNLSDFSLYQRSVKARKSEGSHRRALPLNILLAG